MGFHVSAIDAYAGPRDSRRRFRPERPPVLLLGGGANLIRPLGFAGIPVIVASPDAREPALNSRYCHGWLRIPSLARREAVVDTLLAAGDRLASELGRRIPLYYGDDDYLNLIYEFRDSLEARFLLLLNDPDIACALIDKERFDGLARVRGLTLPRALAWDGTGSDALGAARHPVLVKPRLKVGWENSVVHHQLFGGQGKARVFESGREVIAHPLAHQLRDQLTFQEFIRGDDRQLWSFHGVADEAGTLLAGFVGHKLRTAPPLTGMSSFLELAHDDELVAIGRSIVARLPIKGVFKIDFKKDAATGRYYMLEINARFNLWHHVAAKNGLNLPQVAYDYLVNGARPARTAYGTGFRWVCFPLDYRAFRHLQARDEMTLGAWLASLLASRKVYDLFSWTDPLPFLHSWVNRVKSRLRRSLYQGISWLQKWLSMAS